MFSILEAINYYYYYVNSVNPVNSQQRIARGYLSVSNIILYRAYRLLFMTYCTAMSRYRKKENRKMFLNIFCHQTRRRGGKWKRRSSGPKYLRD